MQEKKIDKNTRSGKERLEVAKKDFDKMMKEVDPFIRKRSTRVYSNTDRWMVTSEQKQQQVNK